MKITYKVLSIITIVIGGFAVLEGINSEDFAALVGGAMFLAIGIMGLNLLKDLK